MSTSVTETLRQQREALSLTLADAAHETRIPVDRLRLLEEGKFASIGSMAYAKSYLKIYGRFLGVNTQTIVDSLPQPILGGVADYRYLVENHGPWVDEAQPRRFGKLPRPAPMPQAGGRRIKAPVSPVTKAAAMLAVMGAATAYWVSKMPVSGSSPITATEVVSPEPVAMAVLPPTESAPAVLNNVIPWQKVNKTNVRAAQVVEDDEEPGTKGQGPAMEVRPAVPVIKTAVVVQ
ncbi:MAG: helix-turn-helix domain-containing protein [Verrucomicrobiaceae bacterium]|nr:helix-turn-helix domain-containing protein [Verrucomicrobiaceae bacterium]